MKTKVLSILIGMSLVTSAIAVPTLSQAQDTTEITDAICDFTELEEIDELEGIALTSQQASQIDALERDFKAEYETLDSRYNSELNAILTPEQQQQLEQISSENDLNLTTEQEARLVALEDQLWPQYEALSDRYEAGMESILTEEQRPQYQQNLLNLMFPELAGINLTRQQVTALWQTSESFDAEVNQLLTTLPDEWTPESEQAFEALETSYEQKLQDILDADQYQQWQQNAATLEAACIP